MAAAPHPTITVIEDLDPSAGVGAWWGEVQTHLHRGLGSLGVITNGSVRDLEGALIQLVATASLLKRRLDLSLTRAALHKLSPAPEPLRPLCRLHPGRPRQQ